MYSISLEVVEIQGYVWLMSYFHYFTPGNLRLKTRRHQVPLYRLRHMFEDVPSALENRRWMLKHESPYPGYCRAPGKSECLPLFCNCTYLTQEWNKKWRNSTRNINKSLLYKRMTLEPKSLP